MKFTAVLSLLAFANLAHCGVVSGGISTVLTPPVAAEYATGYGTGVAVDHVHLSHGTVATSGASGLTVAVAPAVPRVLGSGGIGIGSGIVPVVGVGSGIGSILGAGSGLLLGTGNVVDAGTTYSQNTHHVAIPVPQPVPVLVNRPVAVPVAVPQPVEVPRPVPVEVPHPVKVVIPKPYPVAVPRPVPVPVHKPVYVKVPKLVPVSVPQPYPVVVHKPVPVSVPTKVEVEVPVGIHHHHHDHHDHHDLHISRIIPGGLTGGLSSILTGGLSGGHDHGHVHLHKTYASGHGHYISGPNFSGSGSFSNIGHHHHHHHLDHHHDHHVHGSSQLYASNGGYKY